MANRERAARRGHTWEPWPCCNRTVEESEHYRGRPKKEAVCGECRDLMRIGAEERRRASEAGEATYKWTSEHYMWPGYHGPYHFECNRSAKADEPRDAGDGLRRRMFALINALSRPAAGLAWQSRAEAVLSCDETSRRVSRYERPVLVGMDPTVRDAVNELDQAIREALASAYKEGKERGQNILLALADDELSVNEFNRRTTGSN